MIDLKEAYEIINNSKIVIFKWSIGENSPTEFVSESISQFGYTPEDFYTGALKDYWTFVYEADRERVKNFVYDARKNGCELSYVNSYRVVCKNGKIRWVEEQMNHFISKSGEVYERGVLTDITEKKLTAIALSESEARYKELFDTASAIIFTVSSDGRVTNANRSFLKLFSKKIFSSKSRIWIDDYLIWNDQQQYERLTFYNYAKKYINHRITVVMKGKAGLTHTLEVKCSIFYSQENGEEIHVVADDITDKIEAEKRVQYISQHDALTGVYNRLYFDCFIQTADPRDVTIVVGDVNGLKMINDGFGHKYGDEVLIRVAHILQEIFCRDNEFVVRIAGDEFAVVVCDGDVEEKIQQVHRALEQNDDLPFSIYIALGYASNHKTLETLENLFKAADHNMYQKKLRTSLEAKKSMIDSMNHVLQSTTYETKEHVERIKTLAISVATTMNLSQSAIEEVSLTAELHDIGMISVQRECFQKKSTLDAADYAQIMRHPENSYHIVAAYPPFAGVAEYLLSVHEHYDGTGYPQMIRGDEIPVVSRIVMVADAYVSMTSPRPYRKAFSEEEAVEILKKESGTTFDPSIIAILLQILGID